MAADLKSTRLMWLKAILFIAIALIGSAVILIQNPEAGTAVILALTIWASCRAYYFAFYVLERYVDPSFRYSGLGSLLRYLTKTKARSHLPGDGRDSAKP
ncbi:MAG TPA: hypothetical protein VEH04_20785 [Verrucomicrobiae bacterium]|nr:hypothetical protein [Verrucomicrobiae bacterium]